MIELTLQFEFGRLTAAPWKMNAMSLTDVSFDTFDHFVPFTIPSANSDVIYNKINYIVLKEDQGPFGLLALTGWPVSICISLQCGDGSRSAVD